MLQPELVQRLDSVHAVSRYRNGKPIYTENDENESTLYRVVSGLVYLTTLDSEYREITVALHRPGEVFGTEALTNDRRSSTAQCLGNCVVEAVFTDTATAEDFGRVLKSLAMTQQRQLDDVRGISNGSTAERIAYLICQLCLTDLAYINNSGIIELKITNVQLGLLCNIYCQTVSKQLERLMISGLIHSYYRRIQVVDPIGLSRIADGSEVLADYLPSDYDPV